MKKNALTDTTTIRNMMMPLGERSLNPMPNPGAGSAIMGLGVRTLIGAGLGAVIGYGAVDRNRGHAAKKGALVLGGIYLGLNLISVIVSSARGMGWQAGVGAFPAVCNESWGRVAAMTIGAAAIGGLVNGAIVGASVGTAGHRGKAILHGWKYAAIALGAWTLTTKAVHKLHPPAECEPLIEA